MNFLSSSEREELLSQHKKERDSRVSDRLKIILSYDNGKSLEEISEFLLIHLETAKRHLKEYKSEKKLKGSNGGSKSNLSHDQSKELSIHLENQTHAKVKDILDYVFKTYGVKYSNSGMTNWLHKNGFSYKKPIGVPAKADEEAQKAFIEKYNKLEENLEKDEEILFIDSCHPTQATKLSYGWMKKGKDKGKKNKNYRLKNKSEYIRSNKYKNQRSNIRSIRYN